MSKSLLLILMLVSGVIGSVALTRAIDARRPAQSDAVLDEPLYINGPTARRLALSFNGLAADWYWMRSLQYVGRKIIAYDETHEGRISFSSLEDLNLRLLPSLLRISTTLDPQFMAPYEYGAVILPEINSDYAISLLDAGINANPNAWRLYQHLGYVYWLRHDYQKASDVYAAGGRLPGAPAWMSAMAARMKAEGGSRDAAREMYRHLYESSADEAVKSMVQKQVMRLDSLDEREAIRSILADYKAKVGRCAESWRDVRDGLMAARLRVDATGAPVDPSATPYWLLSKDCDVELGKETQVPRR